MEREQDVATSMNREAAVMQAGGRGFFDLESSVDVGLVGFRGGGGFSEGCVQKCSWDRKKDWPFVIASVQVTLEYPRDEINSALFLLDS